MHFLLITLFSIMFSPNFYDNDFKINDIDGKPIDTKTWKGKKVLLVNVASKCGYTPQYEDLQKLHEKYSDKLTIIGFPCNQFLGQEPGTAEEIKSFCSRNYGVTFTITEKIEVKGDDQHPIYQWLTEKENNSMEDSKVKWNFQKYLLDEKGKLIKHFDPGVKPMDEEITSLL